MKIDTIVLSIIGLMTILNSRIDITVIHGNYTLTLKDKLLLLLHQFLILFMILGVFFQTKPFIQFHFGLVCLALLCWVLFGNKCFLADWQRNSIQYTSEDIQRIHKPRSTQVFEFFGIVIPLIIIDLYRLGFFPWEVLMWWILALLIILLLVFMFSQKRVVNETGVSGTGPGYIAPFQGYPGSGVSGV